MDEAIGFDPAKELAYILLAISSGEFDAELDQFSNVIAGRKRTLAEIAKVEALRALKPGQRVYYGDSITPKYLRGEPLEFVRWDAVTGYVTIKTVRTAGRYPKDQILEIHQSWLKVPTYYNR